MGHAGAAGSAKSRMGNIRGSLSTEALAAIGACVVIVVVVALTMRDKKPRFRFDSAASPAATPVAAAPTGSPLAAPASPATPPDLQALFVQGRAESPLIAPIGQPVGPSFITNTDYANPPVYREIREADLGKIYAASPTKNKRVLDKVARLGGFRSPEAMAQAFGYASVDQMLARWDQAIAAGPQFQPSYFGTNAASPQRWQD